MLDPEKLATIRRLYFAEHWKIGTIASELHVHRDTVRAAVETDPLHRHDGFGPVGSIPTCPSCARRSSGTLGCGPRGCWS